VITTGKYATKPIDPPIIFTTHCLFAVGMSIFSQYWQIKKVVV